MATYEEQVKELKELLAIELDACNRLSWPYICAMKNTKEGYAKIEKDVLQICEKEGVSIISALDRIERAYNPNRMED